MCCCRCDDEPKDREKRCQQSILNPSVCLHHTNNSNKLVQTSLSDSLVSSLSKSQESINHSKKMMFRYVCVAVMPALGRSFLGPAMRSTLPKAATSRRILSAASSSESDKQLETEMCQSWVKMQKKGKQLEENPFAVSMLLLSFCCCDLCVYRRNDDAMLIKIVP